MNQSTNQSTINQTHGISELDDSLLGHSRHFDDGNVFTDKLVEERLPLRLQIGQTADVAFVHLDRAL